MTAYIARNLLLDGRVAQKGGSDTEDRAGSQATQKALLLVCAVLGFTGVAAGALGAHAVKALGEERLAWWETAARYHLIHALAVGLLAAIVPQRAKLTAGLFVAGVVLFSGSLYALALSGVKALGMITPFGGLSFLAGWAILGVAAAQRR
jgi:uncharacterized membrane protein YgdD (TMEM256/DUF423 family)